MCAQCVWVSDACLYLEFTVSIFSCLALSIYHVVQDKLLKGNITLMFMILFLFFIFFI